MLFQRKSELCQAIQWRGDNLEDVRALERETEQELPHHIVGFLLALETPLETVYVYPGDYIAFDERNSWRRFKREVFESLFECVQMGGSQIAFQAVERAQTTV